MANTSTLPVEDNVVAAGSAAPGQNFPALDGLRAIAIAAVLVAHFRGGIDIDSPANKSFVFWTDFGWMGVDLFFVLSGFLITGILLDSKKNAQILPWRRFFRPFYGRRILRIFPLYWVYLLIVWKLIRPLAKASVAHSSLFSAAMYYAQEIPKDRFSWHFLYLSNWLPINSPHFPGLTHLWSLAVEEQFYILWPILIYITPRRYLSRLCICGILLAPLVRCLMLRFGAPPFMVYRLTLCRVDALCAGALLAVALREKEGTAFCRAYMNWIGLCSAIGLADVLWGSGSLMWDNIPMLTIGLTLLAGLGSWAIYSVTFKDVGGILASKPLRVIAKYSYCIYVVHPIVWIFLAQPFRLYFSGSIVGSLKTMGAMCVVTFAIAFASWRALESPFLRMKKYFPYPATKTPDPSGEYASRVQTRRTS